MEVTRLGIASLLLLGCFSYEIWSADRVYKHGDTIHNPMSPTEPLICQRYPMSDFCSIEPTAIGGKAGWASRYSQFKPGYKEEQIQAITPACSDDTGGSFSVNSYYCTRDEPYVWRC